VSHFNSGISPEHLDWIQSVLAKHAKVCRAIVFGSRAMGTHKPYSDIDIALFGEINFLDAESIKLGLESLLMPYKFDVIDFNGIKNHALCQHIERVGFVIYEKNAVIRDADSKRLK